MNLLFMLCGGLAFVLLLVHGQAQPGFISIDCGRTQKDYGDYETILYTSDEGYVDTGTNHNISSAYMRDSPHQQLSDLRSFPTGIKNCYTINPPQAEQYSKYLIRAIFMYGNYDYKNEPPEFDLYLDGDQWATITVANASAIVTKEIIHVPATSYVHVCLVNTSHGIPFISALELRQLGNFLYQLESPLESGSLKLLKRIDVGSTTNKTVRFPDDVYDRIWFPDASVGFTNPSWEPIHAPNNSGISNSTVYRPPYSVMATAVRPVNGSNSLNFSFDSNQRLYVYMHFVEINETLEDYRHFDVFLNDVPWTLNSLDTVLDQERIIFTIIPEAAGQLNYSIRATKDSNLPPILNAIEVYEVLELQQSPTKQSEVDAIRNIKSAYRLEKNWQGDPCVPKNYAWDNLQCHYDSISTRIISLNLSSSSLSGDMNISFSGLKSLESLDLSNNSLTGQVPDFLSRLPSLKTLNLSQNNFTGSIPSALIEKSENRSLTLSTEGNLHLAPAGTLSNCQEDSCARKKNYAVPVIASLASCLVIVVVILAIWWSLKIKKQQEDIVKSNAEDEIVEEKNRHFTYSELLTITNNFQKILGKGAFGSVYAGHLPEGTQVAVKMLSLQSTQGSKQFRTEAQLLTKIHHRNLVSIIGFCNDGTHMGLIYEYMANGTIQEHLSEKNANILSWEKRLRIACDAAQGLEYLHDGCKPPIVHRDIKTVNILLAEDMQAKISDFGISRLMSLDGKTPVPTTVAAGTPGYMDPEYQESDELNEKSDVYSFGIVLLELITGKPPILKAPERTHIVKWVMPMVERAEIKEIVDSRLNSDFDTNSAWKVVETAMACVEHNSIQRPAMRQVVAKLRECLEMEIARVMDWKEKEAYNSASGSSLYVALGSLVGGPTAR